LKEKNLIRKTRWGGKGGLFAKKKKTQNFTTKKKYRRDFLRFMPRKKKRIGGYARE